MKSKQRDEYIFKFIDSAPGMARVSPIFGQGGSKSAERPVEDYIHSMEDDGWKFVSSQYETNMRIGFIIVMKRKRKKTWRKK